MMTWINNHLPEKITAKYTLSWARLISDVFSPPVVWAVLAFPIALRDAQSRSQAIQWAITYTVLVCILPVVYVALMVRRGKITDIHMQVRKQRILPFMVSIACTLLAWGVLRLMGAPALVPQLAIFTLVQLALMLVITFVWQISMHAMSITGAVVATGALFGPAPAFILFPLIPIVGVARLKLRRHTPAQVAAGVVLGALVPLILFSLLAT
jgi:membrane-associated phospholipid phosphatase